MNEKQSPPGKNLDKRILDPEEPFFLNHKLKVHFEQCPAFLDLKLSKLYFRRQIIPNCSLFAFLNTFILIIFNVMIKFCKQNLRTLRKIVSWSDEHQTLFPVLDMLFFLLIGLCSSLRLLGQDLDTGYKENATVHLAIYI